MDLFNPDIVQNILPFDGEVIYHGLVLNKEQCNRYFEYLISHIPWEHDQAIVFGKHYTTKRKVSWFGDREYSYKYSGVVKRAHLWTNELLQLKELVEKVSGSTYNSCLLNLYHTGEEGMAWHSDGEKSLENNGTIASLTLGAVRKFSFKHKETKQRVDITLDSGSLLLMKGTTQKNWLHRLPPTKKVTTPRINLTFRTIVV